MVMMVVALVMKMMMKKMMMARVYFKEENQYSVCIYLRTFSLEV